jgi:pilus assembly protein CpaF
VVASAIDLVVQVSLSDDGVRRVMEVAKVTGRFENDKAEIETVWRWNGTEFEKGLGVID